ncbi:intermembrane transport protein PqiB [Acidisphaera sp. L21]|uniref:PqiB family protein n=1 Tax=Acidisphaera sp. L21 TaxID=1641851 RepID=UPI00131C0624|nr:MlaD family protein [Acidisphaera sp. L21]
MSDQTPPSQPDPPPSSQPNPRPYTPPEAHVRRKSGFSLVWILPIVAAVIGGYLAFTTLSRRGPEIVITFQSAEGLTAGQTRVRHKAVDLGTVTGIRLSSDMSHVIVHVRMTREADPYLTDKARFWVVRPRLSASNISGLETLLSGGYIEMDPGTDKDAKSQTEYTGLENPPGVRSDEPGTTFKLTTARIGSLGSGSPVFYRDITVGEVLGYQLPEGNGPIDVNVFVRAPYDKWVRSGTRFWNASGLSVELGGSGVHVELESIQAVLSGGVAFSTPEDSRETPSAASDASFRLYDDEPAANAAGYKERLPFVLYFQTSTAGLSVGSPVQMYGITIGNVTNVRLELDPVNATARVRVAIEVQPERLSAIGGNRSDNAGLVAQRLVDHGMRAGLSTISYLTGSMAVSLDFPQSPPPAKVTREGDAYVLPTQGGGLGGITTALSDIANKIGQIPFAAIGANANGALAAINGLVGSPELKNAVAGLAGTLQDVQGLVRRTDAGLSPLMRRLPEVSSDLQSTIARANRLVGSVDAGYGANSQFSRDLERLMSQLNDGVRSIRLLADFLDRHPEALIRGRTNTGADR